MSEFICATCDKKKPVSDFGKDKTTRMGHKYECKECVNSKRRGNYSEENRDRYLQSKYGITSKDYANIANRQNWCCAICKEIPNKRSGGARASDSIELFVDHDHVSGGIRGLLCHKCNIAIGLMRDNPIIVENASNYLRGMPVEYIGLVKCA